MLYPRPIHSLYALLLIAPLAIGQAAQPSSTVAVTPFTFSTAVNEVSLTFHAEDVHGNSITDLKPGDLTIYDNLKEPRKVLVLQPLRNLPIRIGVLLDTSESMSNTITLDRSVASTFIRNYFHPATDKAFVEFFGAASQIAQSWTNTPYAVINGIAGTISHSDVIGHSTALFDTVYSACFYNFGKSQQPVSGNVILLFTDGVDNSSDMDLKSAVDMCQQSDTAVYAFYPHTTDEMSSGTKNLKLLTSQTGGDLFKLPESGAEAAASLKAINADLRNRYWLIYRPAILIHNGAFHHIYVGATINNQAITIDARAGYYAPDH